MGTKDSNPNSLGLKIDPLVGRNSGLALQFMDALFKHHRRTMNIIIQEMINNIMQIQTTENS